MTARCVRAPLAALASAATATALVALVDPNQPGRYPTCPFLALTGTECPGCGGLRAVHALTQGEFGAALAHNALVVAAIPLAFLGWLVWMARSRPGLSRVENLPGSGVVSLRKITKARGQT